ncbi:MAG: endonuclease, partial [Pseudarthrobacter sp.]|nr:endonuclease [Pseudarthrobacter sp.]
MGNGMGNGTGGTEINADALLPAAPAAAGRPSGAAPWNVRASPDDIRMNMSAGGEEIGAAALFPDQAPAPDAAVCPSADAHRNVSASLDDAGMGNGTGRTEINADALLPAAPAAAVRPSTGATRNVSASMDDVGMGIGAGTAAVMDGVHASVARLDALFLEDARLEADADAGADGSGGAVVDVLQRRYEIRLERLAVTKQLEAQIAAVKARDAAEAVEIQHSMTPPEAPVHERTYAEISAVEEIAGVLTI